MSSYHQDLLFALIDLVPDFKNLLSCIVSRLLILLSPCPLYLMDFKSIQKLPANGFSYEHGPVKSLLPGKPRAAST